LALSLERCPGRRREVAVESETSGSRGSADSAEVAGILQVVRWAPPVEQSCRDDLGDLDNPDARDGPDVPDGPDAQDAQGGRGARDGTKHWMREEAAAVERVPPEAARRPPVLEREPLLGLGAPIE